MLKSVLGERDLIRDLISSVGTSLGASVAMPRGKVAKVAKKAAAKVEKDLGIAKNPVAKRRRARNKKAGRAQNAMGNSVSFGSVTGPVAQRINRTIRTSSKTPYAVPITMVLAQVTAPPAGGVGLQTVGLATTGLIAELVSFSPYLTSTADARFPVFAPPNITKLTDCFAQYRIRPGSARLFYCGSVATSVNGSIALGAIPTLAPAVGATVTYQMASGAGCAITCAPWTPRIEFPRDRLETALHTRNDAGWKYCDFDGTTTPPEIRECCFLSLMSSHLGVATGAGVLGMIELECVIEFLANEDVLDLEALTMKHDEAVHLVSRPAPQSPGTPYVQVGEDGASSSTPSRQDINQLIAPGGTGASNLLALSKLIAARP